MKDIPGLNLCAIFDRECTLTQFIVINVFIKFIQVTIDGAELVNFETKEPPGGMIGTNY